MPKSISLFRFTDDITLYVKGLHRGIDKIEMTIYLVSSFVVVVVSGNIYVEVRYIFWLENESKRLMGICYELEISKIKKEIKQLNRRKFGMNLIGEKEYMFLLVYLLL